MDGIIINIEKCLNCHYAERSINGSVICHTSNPPKLHCTKFDEFLSYDFRCLEFEPATPDDYLSLSSEKMEDLTIKPSTPDQTAKKDEGKPQISLVPTQIFRDIAEVRMYGNKKYGDPDNWKTVEKRRYVDALMRHLLAYIDDPDGVDEESGIPHYKHAACNMAFICAMERSKDGI